MYITGNENKKRLSPKAAWEIINPQHQNFNKAITLLCERLVCVI